MHGSHILRVVSDRNQDPFDTFDRSKLKTPSIFQNNLEKKILKNKNSNEKTIFVFIV